MLLITIFIHPVYLKTLDGYTFTLIYHLDPEHTQTNRIWFWKEEKNRSGSDPEKKRIQIRPFENLHYWANPFNKRKHFRIRTKYPDPPVWRPHPHPCVWVILLAQFLFPMVFILDGCSFHWAHKHGIKVKFLELIRVFISHLKNEWILFN